MAGSTGAETPDDLVRDRLAPDAPVGIAARPHPGLAALDRKLASKSDAVRHVEARAPELADLGGDLDVVAELDRDMEAGLRIDQRDPDDVVGGEQVLARHSQHALEHLPGGPVEILEESAVENDAGGVAMAPFDPQALVVDEVRHRSGIGTAEAGQGDISFLPVRNQETLQG